MSTRADALPSFRRSADAGRAAQAPLTATAATTTTVAPPRRSTTAPGSATSTTVLMAPETPPGPTPATITSGPPASGPTATGTRPPSKTGRSQTGTASWYDFGPGAGICAHRTLPLGTVVRVVNVANGRAVRCRVGDRGPYAGNRILDLDEADFARVADRNLGTARVRISW